MSVPMVVDQKSVEAANIRVPLPTRVLDIFRSKNEVTVEWSTGHQRVILFWGADNLRARGVTGAVYHSWQARLHPGGDRGSEVERHHRRDVLRRARFMLAKVGRKRCQLCRHWACFCSRRWVCSCSQGRRCSMWSRAARPRDDARGWPPSWGSRRPASFILLRRPLACRHCCSPRRSPSMW